MLVYNIRDHDAPKGSVYIGRPSYWGNPFSIGKDGNRAAVVEKHRQWLLGQLKSADFHEKLRELSKAPGVVCFLLAAAMSR